MNHLPNRNPESALLSSTRYHLVILVVSITIVALAFVLETRADGRVFVRSAPELVLPHTCASKVMFNLDCAGCGLTRSFIHLAAFRWQSSWTAHRAGWIVALFVAAQIPFRLFQIRRIRTIGEPYSAKWVWCGFGFVVVSIVGHWFLALAGI